MHAAVSIFVVSLVIVPVCTFPHRTEASVFSNILSAFVTKKSPEVPQRELHSASIALPKASHAVDPDMGVGGGSDIEVSGGSALVAESGPLGTMVDIIEGNKAGTISTRIVEKGDTIGSIAKEYNVSINTIRWANELKSNTLKLGQELVILPVTGVRYTVKNGGSLRDIVKKYGGDASDAARFNNLDEEEELKPGTIVIIPDATDQAFEAEISITKNGKKETARVVRSGQTNQLRGAGGPAYPGYFVHPLNNLGTKTQGLHGFNGIDIGAPVGTAIIASASGTVVVSKQPGWNGGYGAYVVVQHDNGTQTLYAHMSKNTTSLGSIVAQGDTLGFVGSTGHSSGPHIHFEIRGAKNPF
jgi:murein DD-endopeptidase MepM/ murein hydrolase activator NlpD